MSERERERERETFWRDYFSVLEGLFTVLEGDEVFVAAEESEVGDAR